MNEPITPTMTIMEQPSSSSSSFVSPKLILPYYSKEVDAVHESIQNAINLIQYYSEEQDNMTSTTTVNKTTTTSNNPDEIYHQLDTARNQISEACQTLYDVIHATDDDDDDDTSCNNDNTSKQQEQQQQYPLSEQEQIRIAYLNMITDSFGNVLEQYHIAAAASSNSSSNNNSSNDIDVLADCLQSGYDMLTLLNSSSSRVWYDNDFLWNENEQDEDDDDDKDDDDEEEDDNDEQYITPHERHRQELGFQLIN